MDAQQLLALDDAQYAEVAVSQIHPPARDKATWEALTGSPEALERSRKAYEDAWLRTGHALRTRKAERDAFHQECFERGDAGKRVWFATRSEYEDWRRRASNFHQTVQRALGEVRKLQKRANRDANAADRSQDLREGLRKAAIAIQRHQAQHAKVGAIAEQHDYELWQILDRITVPYGPDPEQVSLRGMLDICWTDVLPVNEVEERRQRAERTMRSAPAGRASEFSGTPRARHVGNDKRLA